MSANEEGFALIEALVALAVAALVISVVIGSLVAIRQRQSTDRDRVAATELAARLVDEGGDQALDLPVTSGRFGEFDWSREIDPGAADPEASIALRRIRVTIRHGNEVVLGLTTMRLAPRPASDAR